LFGEVHYTWPLLAGLMWVAAQNHGTLNVLDFGGSLGSAYFQNLAFLRSLPEVRWNVVEQPGHAAVGKEYFEDNTLKFYATIDACLEETQPNVVLLGSVLQYLEHPYKTLYKLSSLPCRHMIVDRTPIWEGATDRLCVQKVSPDIYPATYPSWIFSRTQFVSHLDSGWTPLAEYENPDKLPGPVDFSYQGMILVRPGHDGDAERNV
jgi:putative methyltransferase (TIGR04325 family)